MKTLKISLNSIDKVKAFVNEISKFDCDFDLVSGRYVIDAKSIMGIFSLDLSKPINLNIHAEGSTLDSILAVVTPYVIERFCIVPVSDRTHQTVLKQLHCATTYEAVFLYLFSGSVTEFQ